MQENLSHAYLIVSASAQERESAARDLARKMLCDGEAPRPCGTCRHCRKVLAGIHPDLIFVEREKDEKGTFKREFKVDQMREMLADAWVKPNEAQRKVYILRDAQTLNQSAQNAILKLLEEPPGGACFILCADNAAALLDTVRSRCVEWNGAASSDVQFNAETTAMAEDYLRCVSKNDLPGLLMLFSGWEKTETETFRMFVSCILQRVTDAICLRSEIPGVQRNRLFALAELFTRADAYLRVNVSTKHILGLLSAESIPEQRK